MAPDRQSSVPTRRAVFAILLLLGWPGAAFAHAFLVRAVPAAGTTVGHAPPRLVLRFTEAVVPHFCRVRLRGPDGRLVPLGPPRAARGHRRVLVVRLPPLTPGRYAVTWHAVSTDTHRTHGAFAFTLAAPRP